jgi:hypothetical protein
MDEDNLEITEQQFKSLSIKEQNLILYKNTKGIKMAVNKSTKLSSKAAILSGIALTMTLMVLGFLIEHIVR